MTRRHPDWLKAYLEYSSYSEAQPHMRFWCGISAIAGALRRKVWIDQFYFKWFPNFYIVLVAPPGVVAKSTTVSVAINLLRRVEGIKFGPDVVTWPALVETFAGSAEAFDYAGAYHTMCAMTLESSEFGNLLDPQDRAMVDLYVSLWDGKQGSFKKETKTSGNDEVVNPWINMIACTTPAWIAGSFPEYMIGGGFTSRCIFVYAEEKHQLIANPGRSVPKGLDKLGDELVQDLGEISLLCGEYKLTDESFRWTEAWYERHNKNPNPHLNDSRFGGYLARKQTHLYKTAIIIAASKGAGKWLEPEHFAVAEAMLNDLEPDMVKVFSKIGMSEDSVNMERLLMYIRRNGPIAWEVAYQHVHVNFPKLKNFEDIMAGLIRTRLIQMTQGADGKVFLTAPPPNIKVHKA